MNIGDKIVVTDTEYPQSVPNGTVMTVQAVAQHHVMATVDGEDYVWFMDNHRYKPYYSERTLKAVAQLDGRIPQEVLDCIEMVDELYDSQLAQRARDALGIKPEVKRETVTLYGKSDKHGWLFWPAQADDTHKITFELIDGIPDPDTIRMEQV